MQLIKKTQIFLLSNEIRFTVLYFNPSGLSNKNERMIEVYDPKEDWALTGKKWIGLHGGEYEFTFESSEIRQGSRCSRSVFADTKEEAWEKITEPPKW